MSEIFTQPNQPAIHGNAEVTLQVSPESWTLMIQYALAAHPTEICGYAWVKRHSSTWFELVPGSIFIPEQLAGKGSSEPTPIGSSQAMDRAEDYPEDYIQLLWHSHVEGIAHFSGTDTGTYNSFERNSLFDNHMFLVLNVFGDAQATVELYRPVRASVPMCVRFVHEVDDGEVYKLAAGTMSKLMPYPKPAAKTTNAKPSSTTTLLSTK